MSRGLGPMQREILAAYDQLSDASPQPVTRRALQERLTATHPAGASFDAAFSRALHSLCLRGHLIIVGLGGLDYPYRGEHIQMVVKPATPLRIEPRQRTWEKFNAYRDWLSVNSEEISLAKGDDKR